LVGLKVEPDYSFLCLQEQAFIVACGTVAELEQFAFGCFHGTGGLAFVMIPALRDAFGKAMENVG